MFCPQCGTKNGDDSRFCESCGSNLAAAGSAPVGQPQAPQPPPQAAQPPPQPPPQATQPPPPYQPPQQQYAPPPAYAPPPPIAPKPNTGMLIGIGAAVAVVAAGAGYWFFLRGGSEGNKFDPAKADTLAHASMISTGDLPGSGWAITAVDGFDTGDEAFSADSCAPIKSKMQTFRNSMTTNRAGRAEFEFTQQASSPNGSDTSVTVNVDIQKDAKSLSSNLAAYTQAIQAGELPKCLEDSFKSLGADSVKVTKGTPAVTAPKGGTSSAYDIAMSIGGLSFSMRLENYAWAFSNAAVSVSMTGDKANLTAPLATAAVTKTQAQLEKVASGTFTPPVIPTAAQPTVASRTPTTAPRTPTSSARTTPTPSPLTSWASGVCKAINLLANADDPVDFDFTGMTLDASKTKFQQLSKTFGDVLATMVNQLKALKPPQNAASLNDLYATQFNKAKALYDIASVQVGLAKTQADFNTAKNALEKGLNDIGTAINGGFSSAPADVQQAINNCQ